MQGVKELMGDGFGFTCAACERLHEGLLRGADVCSAGLAGLKCGGPLIGLSFPLYKGPMSRETLAKTCFMCGVDANKILQAEDGGYVGVCNTHMEHVRKNATVESGKLLEEDTTVVREGAVEWDG